MESETAMQMVRSRPQWRWLSVHACALIAVAALPTFVAGQSGGMSGQGAATSNQTQTNLPAGGVPNPTGPISQVQFPQFTVPQVHVSQSPIVTPQFQSLGTMPTSNNAVQQASGTQPVQQSQSAVQIYQGSTNGRPNGAAQNAGGAQAGTVQFAQTQSSPGSTVAPQMLQVAPTQAIQAGLVQVPPGRPGPAGDAQALPPPARLAQVRPGMPGPGPGLDLDNPSPATQEKVTSLIGEILEPEATLSVSVNRSKLIRLKQPVTRVSITTPNLLDVVQFSPTEFELIGKDEGETTMTLWFGQNQVLRYLIKVTYDQGVDDRRKMEYAELQNMINEMFPNSAIQLIPIADKLIVRGQARDSQEATQIMAVLRGQGGGGVGGGGFGNFGGGGNVLGQGSVAVVHPGTSNLPASGLISLLDVPGEQQVMLKVRVAELTRTALRQMAADFSITKKNFSLSSILGAGGNVSAIFDGGDVELFIKALSSNSYSKILAEPNLTTLSGQSASFIAGGQFAVPTAVGIGGIQAATTFFQGFGTQLIFTPSVIDKDRIRLSVAPTVSSLNQSNAVNGIPGLNTRSAFTTVEIREGQWLAIAGLIQDAQTGSSARLPILGDIPVVNLLFSNKSIKRDETELIILVGPELVHPMEGEQVPLLLPGMEVTEPTNLNFYLVGSIEGNPNCHHRSTVWPKQQKAIRLAVREAKRQSRYQKCEEYYVAGPHGFSE
jgi:pilus assembly protein CpaC